MDGFEDIKENFEIDSKFDREPVKLLKNRSNVVRSGDFTDNSGSRVLDQLELIERFMRETKKKRITVINTGGDKAVYKNRGGLNSERRTKTVNVA